MDTTMYRSLAGTTPQRIALKLLGGSFLGGFAVAAGISASNGGATLYRSTAAVTKVVNQPVEQPATSPRQEPETRLERPALDA